MGESNDPRSDPVVHPRLITRLKNRRRLIDFGLREEFLEEMESVTKESRKPDRLAERVVRSSGERVQRASARVTRRVFEQGNQSILKNL